MHGMRGFREDDEQNYPDIQRQDITNRIPIASIYLNRMMLLSSQSRHLVHELRQTPYLPTTDEFDVAPPGADSKIRDQLSSLKAMLDHIHEDLWELSELGCHVEDLEQGEAFWMALEDGERIRYDWKLGDREPSRHIARKYSRTPDPEEII